MDQSSKRLKNQSKSISVKTLPQNTISTINFSSQTTQCRICLEQMSENEILDICSCKGNLSFIHEKCLIEWIKKSTIQGNYFEGYHSFCDVCRFKIPLKTELNVGWNKNSVSEAMKEDCCCILTMAIFLIVGILILGLAVFGFTGPEYWKDMQILLLMGAISALILIFFIIGFFVFKYIVILEIKINGIEKRQKMTKKQCKRIHDLGSLDIVVTKQSSIISLNSNIQ